LRFFSSTRGSAAFFCSAMSALFLRVMHASVPIGFQVGGRAVRDKVAGGARFATNVRKDGDAITPVAA
jgi:hypothetical protein